MQIINVTKTNTDELLNHICKSPICYLNSVLKNCQKHSDSEYKFAYLCYAVEYGCYYKQYIDFVVFSLVTFSKIGQNPQIDFQSISEILDDENLTKFKGELINFAKSYPNNKSQNDLNYEKLINILSTLKILKEKTKPMITYGKFKCICLYFEYIINQNMIEEINSICSLLENEKNEINENFIELLLKKVIQFFNSHSLPISYSLSTYLVPPARIYPFTNDYNTNDYDIFSFNFIIATCKMFIFPIFIEKFLLEESILDIRNYFFNSHHQLRYNINYPIFKAASFYISFLKFQALIDFFFDKIKEFVPINQINLYKNAKQLLSSENCEIIKKGLMDFAVKFPVENYSQYDICCSTIATFYIKLVNSNLDIKLQKNNIKYYFENIINHKTMDEINLVYQLINKSQNEITMDIVNSLFETASTFIFLDEYLLNSRFTYLTNVKKDKHKFSALKEAIDYGFSLKKFLAAIEFFLNIINRNKAKFKLLCNYKLNETFKNPGLNDEIVEETKKNIQKKLADFLRNYPEEVKSENEINCEKIIKFCPDLYEFVKKNDSSENSFIITLSEQHDKILEYFEKIINHNDIDEIDFVLWCIDNLKNDINEAFNILLDAAKEYENKQLCHFDSNSLNLTDLFSDSSDLENNSVPLQENLHEHQEEI